MTTTTTTANRERDFLILKQHFLILKRHFLNSTSGGSAGSGPPGRHARLLGPCRGPCRGLNGDYKRRLLFSIKKKLLLFIERVSTLNLK